MADRIGVINKLRPKIKSQGVIDLEELAKRQAVGRALDRHTIYAISCSLIDEIVEALKEGYTVKLDGLMTVQPSMKVGGDVRMVVRGNRGTVSRLNARKLWTAKKVTNHANLRKTAVELIAQWNTDNPHDPVE